MPAAVQNQVFIGAEDFSAGMNDSDSVYRVPPNAMTTIENMLIDGGDLKPAWGTETISETDLDAVYTWTAQVDGQTPTMTLGIKNQVIYIEEQDGSGNGLGAFRPMYNAASDPETGSSSTTWRGSFVEENGYLYITGLGRKVFRDNQGNPQDVYGPAPLVFDGYAFQTTATVLSGSLNQVTLPALLPSITRSPGSPYLYPGTGGYKITLTDDLGNIETRVIWETADSTGLVFLVDGPFDNPCTGLRAVVAGINYMGIEPPLGCSISKMGTITGGSYSLTLTSPDGRTKATTGQMFNFNNTNNGSVSIAGTVTNIQSELAADMVTLIGTLPLYAGVNLTVSGGPLPTAPFILVWNNLNNLPPPILVLTENPADVFTSGTGIPSCYIANQAPFAVSLSSDTCPSSATWLSYDPTSTATKQGSVYQYKLVYMNKSRGVTSEASAQFLFTTTAANQALVINGIPADPYDSLWFKWGHYQIDAIQIWRTLLGGSTYYLVDTVERNVAGYHFSTTYKDTKPDKDVLQSGTVVPQNGISGINAVVWSDALNSNHDLPPALDWAMEWNGSIWGVNHFIQKDFRKSTMLHGEYWALVEAEGISGTSDLTTAGSYFQIGTFSDPIVGALPDVGSWITTGIAGSCLVVYTRTGAKRLFGSTLDNIDIVETGFPGLLAREAAANCNGLLVWASPEGVVAAAEGASTARVVDRAVRNDMPLYGASGGLTQWSNACSTYWQSYFVIVAPNASGTMQGWLCYLGVDKIGGNQFSWTRYTALDGVTHFHNSTANGHTSGVADDLWACNASQVLRVGPWLHQFQGSPIPFKIEKQFGKMPGTKRDRWTVRWVDLEVETGAADNIDLAVNTTDVGQLQADGQYQVDPYTKTIICDGRYGGLRRLISIPTESLCRWPLVSVTGNLPNADFRILSMEAMASREGDASQVGE